MTEVQIIFDSPLYLDLECIELDVTKPDLIYLDKVCAVCTYLAGGSDEGCGSSSIFCILAKGNDEHGEASELISLTEEEAALENVSDLEELDLAMIP